MRCRKLEVTRRADSPTSWSRVLPEKLAVPLLVKKFPAFNETWNVITAFTRARYLFCPEHINPVHTPPNFLKINFNITLPSAFGSSKWPLSCRWTLPKPCTHLCSHTYHMPRPSHLDLVTRMVLGGKYRSLSSSFCVASTPWMKATKFRTHIRRQTKLRLVALCNLSNLPFLRRGIFTSRVTLSLQVRFFSVAGYCSSCSPAAHHTCRSCSLTAVWGRITPCYSTYSASVRSFVYISMVFLSECVELWCDNAVEDDQWLIG